MQVQLDFLHVNAEWSCSVGIHVFTSAAYPKLRPARDRDYPYCFPPPALSPSPQPRIYGLETELSETAILIFAGSRSDGLRFYRETPAVSSREEAETSRTVIG